MKNILNVYQEFVKLSTKDPPELRSLYGPTFAGSLHGALGLVGEAGEVLDLHKKQLFGQKVQLPLHFLISELGDILWYLTRVANAHDLDLDYIMRSNMEKLAIRYPELMQFVHEQTRPTPSSA